MKPDINIVTGQAQNIAYQVNKVADQLATAIGNKLDRFTPEPMQADIDMNGHGFLNLSTLTLEQLEDLDLTNTDVYVKDATAMNNPVTLNQLQQEALERSTTDNYLITLVTGEPPSDNFAQELISYVVSQILLIDGAGSGFDADLLDGLQGSYYLNSANINYDGTTTGIPSTNVQDAINYVYENAAAELAEDPSPELSAELDCNDNTIGFTETLNTSVSGEATIDWRRSNKQAIILTEDTNLTFIPPSNPASLQLRVKQDAIGNHYITFPYDLIKTPSGYGYDFSKEANAEDLFLFYYDGSNYIATVYNDIKTSSLKTFSKLEDTVAEFTTGTLNGVQALDAPPPTLKLNYRPVLEFVASESDYAKINTTGTYWDFGYNEFAVEITFKANSLGTTQAIVSREESADLGWAIKLLSSGVVQGEINALAIASANTVAVGEWHTAKLERLVDRVNLYLDGNLETTVMADANSYNMSHDWGIRLAKNGYSDIEYFDGQMYDLKIYLLNPDLNPRPDGLFAYFPMTEGSGTVTYDVITGDNSVYFNLYGATWIQNNDLYMNSGYKIGTALNASSLKTINYNRIYWNADAKGQTLTVSTTISTDGGTTWTSYTPVTNGGKIPDIAPNCLIGYKIDFATNNITVSPELYSIGVEVKGFESVIKEVIT